jgi:hypothetical protein
MLQFPRLNGLHLPNRLPCLTNPTYRAHRRRVAAQVNHLQQIRPIRLLRRSKDGKLTFREFAGADVPAYAILSHTWGPATEEVSFQDLELGTSKEKSGYRKILFCEKQAATDGLHYFWVDTCCIDKRNNTELTKAINSMFRWYGSAARCYVYLSDVPTSGSPNEEVQQNVWEAKFRKSRWFTRGWTLQELLAPAAVQFYSSHGKYLGDKQSLVRIIHETTGISVTALQGHPLESFSVTERMAWAAKRQTTEEEDAAYCLLGIFNTFMPLIYGEGRDSALKRLQREVDGRPPTGTL